MPFFLRFVCLRSVEGNLYMFYLSPHTQLSRMSIKMMYRAVCKRWATKKALHHLASHCQAQLHRYTSQKYQAHPHLSNFAICWQCLHGGWFVIVSSRAKINKLIYDPSYICTMKTPVVMLNSQNPIMGAGEPEEEMDYTTHRTSCYLNWFQIPVNNICFFKVSPKKIWHIKRIYSSQEWRWTLPVSKAQPLELNTWEHNAVCAFRKIVAKKRSNNKLKSWPNIRCKVRAEVWNEFEKK